ncbi:hypothetical protein CBM2598_U10269 [Cupriavidus taiwanensis]|uniref:Uncharacterized protein n=1 Tax=Cupriavidus taiwanensis TaxID=164546 RepID=A0A7Z7JFF2_9BURK|nr:hypothetical protein CBM2597_U10080 [Cupriavidus taiwanensis]SOZ96470.1 hypothetical protein CBM2598_U10269 [Cupriavidus taiwanensis]SPC25586.1 hypothetical protein CBM2594_U10087 [Cupriavidus taiwanensis]
MRKARRDSIDNLSMGANRELMCNASLVARPYAVQCLFISYLFMPEIAAFWNEIRFARCQNVDFYLAGKMVATHCSGCLGDYHEMQWCTENDSCSLEKPAHAALRTAPAKQCNSLGRNTRTGHTRMTVLKR